jgi:hypothetical protein
MGSARNESVEYWLLLVALPDAGGTPDLFRRTNWFGRLPGDVRYESDRVTFTSIVSMPSFLGLSLILSCPQVLLMLSDIFGFEGLKVDNYCIAHG